MANTRIVLTHDIKFKWSLQNKMTIYQIKINLYYRPSDAVQYIKFDNEHRLNDAFCFVEFCNLNKANNYYALKNRSHRENNQIAYYYYNSYNEDLLKEKYLNSELQ